jgi:hypothetical protein
MEPFSPSTSTIIAARHSPASTAASTSEGENMKPTHGEISRRSAAEPQVIELPFLPSRPLAVTERTELAEQLERDIFGPARAIGRNLPTARGPSEQPSSPCIWQDGSRSWYFASYLEDPSADESGRIPVPQEQLARLEELFRAGVHCDLVWIGHELPETWKPGDPLVPEPPRTRRQREALDTAVTGLSSGVKKAADAAETVGRGVEKATLGAAMVTAGLAAGVAAAGVAAVLPVVTAAAGAPASALLVIGMDPVVLGGIIHSSGSVMWVELARWNWT